MANAPFTDDTETPVNPFESDLQKAEDLAVAQRMATPSAVSPSISDIAQIRLDARNARQAELDAMKGVPTNAPKADSGIVTSDQGPSPSGVATPQISATNPPETDGGIPFAPQAQPAPAAQGPSPFDLQKQGIMDEAAASAKGLRQSEAAQKAFEDKQAKYEADYTQQYKDIQAQRDQLRNDIASHKIDSNRLWSSMDTANKVGVAIGLALSAIGNGAAGKEQTGIKILQDAIDRDVKTQLYDQEAKRAKLNDLSSNMAEMASNYYRGVDSRLAAARQQVEMINARTNNAATQAKAKIALATIDQQQQALRQNEAAIRAFSGGSSTGGGIPTKAVPPQLMLDDKFAPRLVNYKGMTYAAQTPEEGKELRKSQAAVNTLVENIDELKRLGTVSKFDTAAAAKARVLSTQVIPLLNEVNGLTRLSGEDIKLWKEIQGDPASLWDAPNRRTQLEKLSERVSSAYEDKLKASTGFQGSPQVRFGVKPGAVK